MKKSERSERDARNREYNSLRLLYEVRRGFQRGRNDHLVYTIKPSQHDYSVLDRIELKHEFIYGSGDRDVVCFYRNESSRPYVLSDRHSAPAVWRP